MSEPTIELQPGVSMTFPLPPEFLDDLTKLVACQNVMNILVRGFAVGRGIKQLNLTWYGDLDTKMLTITGALTPATEPPTVPDAFKDAWKTETPPEAPSNG